MNLNCSLSKQYFLEDFSFGDAEASPFQTGKPTRILRSPTESYLDFYTSRGLSNPDNSEAPGPLATVQVCSALPGQGPPLVETSIGEIAKEQYLSDPAQFRVQLIWNPIPPGEFAPDSYQASFAASKGGPYIYGDVELVAAARPDAAKIPIRVHAPKCETLTQDIIDAWGNVPASDGGPYPILDSSGYTNWLFEGPLGTATGDPEFATEAEALSYFPDFEVFQLQNPRESETSPYKNP